MQRLTDFIGAARATLDFALYDMRLGEPLRKLFSAAPQKRAAAGMRIRICYDGDKPLHPDLAAGQDPAPPGTSAFGAALGYPWRDEIDAQQIYRARSDGSLDRLAQSDR